MLPVHFVSHTDNLVSKTVFLALNEAPKSGRKRINPMKFNAKYERLSKQFCVNENAGYVILSSHTEVRLL